MRKNRIFLLMMNIIILFTISIQNPVVAADLGLQGQALELYKPMLKPLTLSFYTVNESQNIVGKENTSSDLDQIEIAPPQKSTEEYHTVEDAQQEKRLQTIKAAEIHKEIQEKNKKNGEFLKVVRTTDVTRLDLRKPSGLSDVQAEQLLKGTGLEGLGKAFVTAEQTYKVNAYYLIAHAAWESGWGKSRISREKNNLFGYMAYDRSPYESAHGFKTKADSIDRVASFVSKQYLSEEGRYYHGSNLRGMNVRYASDNNWKNGIAKVMVSLAKRTQPVDELIRV
ncbi:glucosaminidase domain-containing protein [Ammoniphilus resinae]|uniref:Beta-N-acetylglucosaminidase n=1 Tax=Ammoniphilus resinae TaxID=861532 RepID=A0ABS4GTZ1_9BACL|nr:glucosaminidase domain-containing protein [Ammoniphilus resinae]MBP1933716.1 beta-N-acetylglucosaminidase [Ammoniphilus resinae]